MLLAKWVTNIPFYTLFSTVFCTAVAVFQCEIRMYIIKLSITRYCSNVNNGGEDSACFNHFFLFRISIELWNISQRHCGHKLERVWLAHVVFCCCCCCIILFSCSDHLKYASIMTYTLILK
jgi:hypothetical protein